MPKKTSPALYELIRMRPEPTVRQRIRQARREAAPQPSRQGWAWLAAGHTLRIPVGWVLLGGAAVLAVAAGAYMFGFLRGENRAETDFDTGWLETDAASWRIPPPEDHLSGVVNPPLAAPARSSVTQTPIETETREAEPPGDRVESGPTAGYPAFVVEPDSATPDPREPGLNYFVLIHTTRDNAVKLAAFWREHGLDAFAIKARNLKLYKVVVMPGYQGGERNSQDVQALEQHIKDVRQKWKLQINARDDLAYYPEKYDP